MDTTKNLPAKRGPKIGNTRLVMTTEREDAFLAAYELSGNYAAAAAIASPNSMAAPRSKPGTASFRAHEARNAAFAVRVGEAKERVVARVYAKIWELAVDGVTEAVVQKGTQATLADGSPATTTRHDPKLLLRLIARLDPAWSEKKNIHYSVTHSAEVRLLPSDLMALSVAQQAQLQDILTTIQASRGEETKALEYAEYEEVDEGNTLAELERADG